jgi:hypothetical protein
MTDRSTKIERRQFGRRETNLHAFILIRGRPRMPCRVRNVSYGGVLVEPCAGDNLDWLPTEFRLVIEAYDFEADCEIRHKGAHGIGVRFLKPALEEADAAGTSSAVQAARRLVAEQRDKLFKG